MRREICGGCHSPDLEEVLDLGSSPLADDFPHTAEEAFNQPTYPLQLLRCGRCSLIQLSYVVPDEILWGGDYGFYTGHSWVAAEQQRQYAAELLASYGRIAKALTVEIACNDGTMLKHFANAGCPTVGVDPAMGPANQAIQSGLNVRIAPFGEVVAGEIVEQYGHAGLIVANNVIAHVADLDDFVEGIKTLLMLNGVAVVEFQYAADLITGNQFDHVYHEHRSFFSLYSLAYVLNRHDLVPVSVKQTTPQGGSLRVVIQHAGARFNDADPSVHTLLQAEAWLRQENALAGLQGRAERIREKLRRILLEQRMAKKIVAGYGASAKSTTLLNFCSIIAGEELVQYFVDTTPMKHGRFTPGTGIPIINPQADSRAPDVYLLGVWNYLPQILRRESSFQGNWIVPIPSPVLL